MIIYPGRAINCPAFLFSVCQPDESKKADPQKNPPFRRVVNIYMKVLLLVD
jgi:hypothetical protein